MEKDYVIKNLDKVFKENESLKKEMQEMNVLFLKRIRELEIEVKDLKDKKNN